MSEKEELKVNTNPAETAARESNEPASPSGPAATGEGAKDYIVGNYRLDRTIGQGTYGKVKLGIHLKTKEKVAVKIIEKAQIQSSKQVARLQREIRFLKLLHHPHIVKVYDVVETNEYIYIIMEYAIGGELFDYIVAHKRVKEKEARSFFRMVLSAVDYCHRNAVIHRDLKPENLLLDDKKCIKIIDFGFGNNFTVNGLLDTFCGSPFYAAPEMISGKKYEGPEVDMWSLGVILFALLCGHLPFDDDNMKELYAKIRTGSYKAPDYLLPNARHLIKRLITVDPKQRATLQEVMNHPWVNEGYDGPPPNYLPERPIITNPDELSKDIINRLLIFGYKMEEIRGAFSPEQEFSLPNPIRSTYFLLSEMVAREQARLRMERRKASAAQLMDTSSNSPKSGSSAALKHKTASILALGKSLPCIDEDFKAPIPSTIDTQNKRGPTVTTPVSQTVSPGVTTPQTKDQVSNAIAESSRRASTPDGYSTYRTVPSKLANFFGSHVKYPYPDLKQLPPLPGKQEAYQTISPTQMGPYEAQLRQQQQKAQEQQSFTRRGSVPVNMMSVDSTSRTELGSTTSLSRRGSAVGKLKEDIKAVSTWLLSVSTTTNKPPENIFNQVIHILKETKSEWHTEGPYSIVCTVDISTFLPGKGDSNPPSEQYTADITTEYSEEDPSSSNSPQESNPASPVLSTQEDDEKMATRSTTTHSTSSHIKQDDPKFFAFKTKTGAVSFQVDIVKVQKMNLHGLHFKRISGGVWNYKKVCNRLLSQLSL